MGNKVQVVTIDHQLLVEVEEIIIRNLLGNPWLMVGQVDDLIVLLLAMIKVVEELLLVTWAEAEVRIPLLKDLDQHEVHPVTPLAAIMVAEDNGSSHSTPQGSGSARGTPRDTPGGHHGSGGQRTPRNNRTPRGQFATDTTPLYDE